MGKLAAGVDVKSSGGMVVAPPSVHESGDPYRWRTGDGGPPARDSLPVAPGWLLELPAKPPSPTEAKLPAGVGANKGPPAAASDAGAQLLVRDHLAAVRDAVEGTRNDVLNRAAFCFGRLAEAGRIDAASVHADLWDACAGYRADDGDAAAQQTIGSGWIAGQGQPLHQGRVSGLSSRRCGGSANGANPGVSEAGAQLGDTRLGIYSLDSPDTLGLEPPSRTSSQNS